MVSETSVSNATTTTHLNRGFIPEESALASGPGFGPVTIHYQAFWRPVIGGAFFALAIFSLSSYLMLGCHVGIDANGVPDPGIGAAIWTWVTACIAFFLGGMISSTISASRGPGWLKGAVLWGFSIPLAHLIYVLAAQTGTAFSSLDLPRTAINDANNTLGPTVHYGFFWSAFITLALALIFSIVGSLSGCNCRKETTTTTTPTR